MKKMVSFINVFLIVLISYLAYSNLDLVIDVTINTFNLFIGNLLPALFFFMIISSLITGSGCAYVISYFLQMFTIPILRLDGISGYVILTSALSGFPNNASIINDLLEQKVINDNKANTLLLFSSFPSPSFVIASIGGIVLKDVKTSFVILISCYLSSFVIALSLRNNNEKPNWMSFNECIDLMQKKQQPLIKLIINSVTGTTKTIAYIASFIIAFGIISNLITLYLPNGLLKVIVLSILEFSSGSSYLAGLPIDLVIKSSLIAMVVCFAGLCVHMQVMSIINISYINYLTGRIIQAILAGLICFSLINFSIFNLVICIIISLTVCMFLSFSKFYTSEEVLD